MTDYDVPLIGTVETQYYTAEETLTFELPPEALPGDFLMIHASYKIGFSPSIIDPSWSKDSFSGIRDMNGGIFYRFLGENEGPSVTIQFERGHRASGLLTVWRNVDPEEPIHSEWSWSHEGVRGQVTHQLHELQSAAQLTRPCKMVYIRSVHHSPHPRLAMRGGEGFEYLGAWGMTLDGRWYTYGNSVHRNGVTSEPGGGEPPSALSGENGWLAYEEMSSLCATVALSALPVAE